MSKYFNIGFRIAQTTEGIKLLFVLKCFGKEFKINLGQAIKFEFKDEFLSYFAGNNINKKVKSLKSGLDAISKEYIDLFMNLSEKWNGDVTKNIWTNYDKKLQKEYEKYSINFKQPFENTDFDPFIFFNKYGLKDLPEDIYRRIDGNTIIDIGGYNGDTAIMFNQNFPNSDIIVYEPIKKFSKFISGNIKNHSEYEKIKVINKGLSDKDEEFELSYYDVAKNLAAFSSLDSELNNYGKSVGLIKIDTEGYESKIIYGALKTICDHKPVLAIAIYHTPQDFFEIKDKLLHIRRDYKFMIRRSECIFPQADIVLIAY